MPASHKVMRGAAVSRRSWRLVAAACDASPPEPASHKRSLATARPIGRNTKQRTAAAAAAAAAPPPPPPPAARASKRPPAAEPPAAASQPPRPSPPAAAAAAGEATRKREEVAWAKGVELCVGCDEAGRGPLAGPVVAAACALPGSAPLIPGVSDSKAIVDEAAREALYEQIVAMPGVVWSARVVSAARIDEINILMASLEAMRLSITDVLKDSPSTRRAVAFVDGPFSPWKEGPKYEDFQQPQPPPSVALEVEPVKRGDATVYCIAAASILAKVTRDRLMHTYDAMWPAYGLAQHKGYPVAKHVAAIAKHGPCAIHRRTFAPLKNSALDPPTEAELAAADQVVDEYEAEHSSRRRS